MNAVPKWVITRYVIPDLRLDSCSCSYITNKKEIRAIISQKKRNEKALFDVTTKSIERMKKLKRKPRPDVPVLDT